MRIPYDYVRELIAKKHEILGELELAKQSMLRELSVVDKDTLAKLRFVVSEFDRLETEVRTKVSNVDATVQKIIDVYVRDPSIIESELNEIRIEAKTALNLIEAVNSDINAFDARITSVVEQYKNADAEMRLTLSSLTNTVSQNNDNLNNKIATVNARIDSAFDRLAEVGDNSSLLAELNALKSKVDELELEIDNIEISGGQDSPDTSGFVTRLQSVETAVASVESELAAKETRLANVEGRVSTLESATPVVGSGLETLWINASFTGTFDAQDITIPAMGDSDDGDQIFIETNNGTIVSSWLGGVNVWLYPSIVMHDNNAMVGCSRDFKIRDSVLTVGAGKQFSDGAYVTDAYSAFMVPLKVSRLRKGVI